MLGSKIAFNVSVYQLAQMDKPLISHSKPIQAKYKQHTHITHTNYSRIQPPILAIQSILNKPNMQNSNS